MCLVLTVSSDFRHSLNTYLLFFLVMVTVLILSGMFNVEYSASLTGATSLVSQMSGRVPEETEAMVENGLPALFSRTR